MSIPETDNRLQFPPTEIDFENQVGVTGEAHDDYPSPSTAPRYDWMRMTLIGLLANQSSEDEPTQKRTGTVWYDRSTSQFKYWNGNAFVGLSRSIAVEETSDSSGTTVVTLADWYASAKALLAQIRPRYTFSGSSSADDVTQIPIPQAIQDAMAAYVDDLHPLVYIDGVLLDPRLSRFRVGCPDAVELLGGTTLDRLQKFTVIIEHFDLMIEDDVVA